MVRLLVGNPYFTTKLHWVGMGLVDTISVYRRCGGGCVFAELEVANEVWELLV